MTGKRRRIVRTDPTSLERAVAGWVSELVKLDRLVAAA